MIDPNDSELEREPDGQEGEEADEGRSPRREKMKGKAIKAIAKGPMKKGMPKGR